MTYYGYIINEELHECLDTDVHWDFTRFNEDESETEYKGIESVKLYFDDPNIVIIGDNKEFNTWVNEYKPEDNDQ